MPTKCRTPDCYRKALLNVRSFERIWDSDKTKAPMCLPCFLAYKHGHKRHPAETDYKVRDDVTREEFKKVREHV